MGILPHPSSSTPVPGVMNFIIFVEDYVDVIYIYKLMLSIDGAIVNPHTCVFVCSVNGL